MSALLSSRLNGFNSQPWFFVDRLHRELRSAFAGDENEAPGAALSAAHADWTPAVDIRETKDAYVITADLPGVNPQDIEVTTEAGLLTIRGTRTAEAEVEGFSRKERVAGSFARRFKLPDIANVEAISAKSSHGVLTLTIAKRAEVQPRKIEIQAA